MWLSESDCQLYEQIFELRVEDGSKKYRLWNWLDEWFPGSVLTECCCPRAIGLNPGRVIQTLHFILIINSCTRWKVLFQIVWAERNLKSQGDIIPIDSRPNQNVNGIVLNSIQYGSIVIIITCLLLPTGRYSVFYHFSPALFVHFSWTFFNTKIENIKIVKIKIVN